MATVEIEPDIDHEPEIDEEVTPEPVDDSSGVEAPVIERPKVPVAEEPKSGDGRKKSEPEPKQAEPNPEDQETILESAQDCRQLLDAWAGEFKDPRTPSDEKGDLAYEIIQLSQAIQQARMRPEQLKIRQAEPGVLGLYDPSHKEPAMTVEGLELPPHRFKNVTMHEAVHMGKFTAGHEIHDEGLTQVKTEQLVPDHMHGVYEDEVRKVKKAFDKVGIDAMIEAYDFKDPDFLAREYLKRLWPDLWEGKFKHEIQERARPNKKPEQLLQDVAGDMLKSVEKRYKDAVKNIYERARAQGFSFKEEQLRILRELYDNDIETERQAA